MAILHTTLTPSNVRQFPDHALRGVHRLRNRAPLPNGPGASSHVRTDTPALRVTFIANPARANARGPCMRISGRLAEVCAELDRLVRLEQGLSD